MAAFGIATRILKPVVVVRNAVCAVQYHKNVSVCYTYNKLHDTQSVTDTVTDTDTVWPRYSDYV